MNKINAFPSHKAGIFFSVFFFIMVVFVQNLFSFDPIGFYKENCTSCHGLSGNGDGPLGKLMSPPIAPFSDKISGELILNGKGKMPSYKGKLSKEEADVLDSYIRSLK